jgi:dihydrofolate reductase
MRDLILWDMVSLDGYFEAPGGDLSWFTFDSDLEKYILDSQVSAGMLLFGRRTFEVMRAYWPTAEGAIADFMNSVPKVVASSTLTEPGWSNTRVIGTNLSAQVMDLKQEPGDGPIFVFGSANLSASLIRDGLVDEIRIGINPILLGVGTPLFRTDLPATPLELVDSRTLNSGLILAHYRPALPVPPTAD